MDQSLSFPLSSEGIAKLFEEIKKEAAKIVVPKAGPSMFAMLAVAKVCHDANRSFSQTLGDFSHQPWDEAPAWQKESALQGVKKHWEQRSVNMSPRDSHDSWMAHKLADGWKYGPVKDPAKKEHPCLVPYDELPDETKAKDHLFGAIVRSFMDSGLL